MTHFRTIGFIGFGDNRQAVYSVNNIGRFIIKNNRFEPVPKDRTIQYSTNYLKV